MSQGSSATLKQLYEENELPGGATLLRLARRAGLQVTRKEVDAFLRQQAERQIFQSARLDAHQGKVQAVSAREKWNADLIHFSRKPDGEYRFALIVCDIYTRKIWLQPTTQKIPQSVLSAYQKIEGRAGK